MKNGTVKFVSLYVVAITISFVLGVYSVSTPPLIVERIVEIIPCAEIKPVIETPKYLGPYKHGKAGVMHARLSFYDLGPGSINVDEFMDGKTATGKVAKPGRTIAVDPKVIPYGSKVFIPGLGFRVAEDTGGAIKGNRIDVLVEGEEKALLLGRKEALVLWVKP